MLKLLDTDNTNLSSIIAYLDNERIEFKDGDIYANRDKVSKQLKSANNLLEALRTELNSIRIKLESTEVSNQNIIKNFKKDQNNLKALEETIEKNSKLFIEVSKEIDKESMNKAKLPVIASIIEKLGQIIYNISSLQSKVDEIKELIKDINSDLNMKNYFKKLNEANIENKGLLDKLAKLGNLIDKLIEVSKIFKDYTSDDDEKKFVNNLGTELLDLKKTQVKTEERLKETSSQISKLADLLRTSPQKVDDSKINKVNSEILDLSQQVDQIEKAVNLKAKRFLDMDLYSKFKRRNKEFVNL